MEQPAQEKKTAEELIQQSEPYMLVLALLAIVLYLVSLLEVWSQYGLNGFYTTVSLVLDLVFVADFFIKVVVLRRSYFKTSWWLVDFLAALPILVHLPFSATSTQGLRFLRGLRFFLLFRTLRALRFLRLMRGLTSAVRQNGETTEESRQYNYALLFATLAQAIFFLVALSFIYRGTEGSPEAIAQAQVTEFYLITGSLFAMGLVLFLVKYQIPDLSRSQMSALLNIALPHQIAQHFIQSPESYNRTVEMPATILFSDIVGFTRTVEALGGNLEALKGHLTSALDAVAEVHRKHDLIIDKFIGDAVMSFRGGDLVDGAPSEHAYRVVRAAIESVTALEKLNDPYFNQIKIGGASSESALIGAFGTSTRLTYTVLGDRVNLAARLEASVKQCRVSNLFCDRTFALTKDRKDILWRRFGQLKVAGKNQTASVYEAFDPSAHENVEWLTTYHHGLDNFESKDFANAKRSFEQTNDTRPGGDAPAMLFAERCDQLMNVDLPEDWQPVIETSK